jgi:hypothetical protein
MAIESSFNADVWAYAKAKSRTKADGQYEHKEAL